MDYESVVGEQPTHGSRWRPALVATLVVAVAASVFALTSPPDDLPAAESPRAPTTEPGPSGDKSIAANDEPSTAGSPDPTTSEPGHFGELITRDGDAVTATGTVVRSGDDPPAICTPQPIAAALAVVARPSAEPYAPACSPLSVPLEVDVWSLPGWTQQDGVGYTASIVTVNGVWRDGTLLVASATAAEAAPGPELGDAWQVPCVPPDGGWAAGDSAGADPELLPTFESALAAEVVAHPDRYHANWYGYPDGDPFAPDAPKGDFGRALPEHVVMVVSTVQEPSEVCEQLAALYPGNLCVTQVDHSSADLDAVVERLEVADGSWVLDAHSLYAAVANTLFLELPVLDDAAVARIGADATMVEVFPLVRPI